LEAAGADEIGGVFGAELGLEAAVARQAGA
jgi:hypothetical protein